MKKRIFAILLSALLMASATACNQVPDNAPPSTKDTSKNVTEETTVLADQDIPSSEDPACPLYSSYSDILEEYEFLLEYKRENAAQIYTNGFSYPYQGEPTEIWNALVFSTERTLVEDAGYCIKDLNNDKISELILINKNYKIHAIFTMGNGVPKLLDLYGIGNQSVAIDENGNIYKYEYGKGENWCACVQQFSADGSLNTLQYGCYDPNTDGNFDPLDLEYYKIYNGERTVINEVQLNELKEQYASFYQKAVETIQYAELEPILIFE